MTYEPSRAPRAATPAAAGLLLQIGLLSLCWISGEDRTVALAGLASFACAAWVGLRTLQLSLLSPAMLYLYALGLFHFGLTGLWAVNLPTPRLPLWFVTWDLAPALTMAITAIACYQLGFTMAAVRERRAGLAHSGAMLHNRVMFHCGLVVMAVGLAALLIGAWQIGIGRLLESSYMESYQLTRAYDPRLLISSLQIVPMGLYLAAAAAPSNRLRAVLLTGLVWGGLIFLAGYRGFALAPLAVLMAIAERRGAGIPRRWLAVAGVIVLLAIPTARIARDKSLDERTPLDLASSSSASAAIAEMGGSIRPLIHTLVLMETEDFRWGYSYALAARMLVPNLALDWQGAQYQTIEELPPSHWVTRIVEPWIYAHHGGIGFSAVAEPYMNFGVPGVVIYFVLLGFGLVRFDLGSGASPARLAIWAMVLGPLIWTARNSYTVFLRPAVWGMALVLAAHALSRLTGSQASRSSRLPAAASERVWSGPNLPLSAKEGAL